MKTLLSRALDLLLGPALGPIRNDEELTNLSKLGCPTVFAFSPSYKLVTRLRHMGYTHLRNFIVLPYRNMPRWMIPISDSCGMLAATQIYMPHKRTPRIIKSLLIRMIRMGGDGWLRSRVLVASKRLWPIENIVGDLTHEHRPLFALSLGRQAFVRKLTIQVMRPCGDILGYMKLPFTPAADERVRHEARMLEQLWNFGVLRPHIPRLLYAGNHNDAYVLFQSPLEGQPGPTSFNGMHQKLLRTLTSVHVMEKPAHSLINDIDTKWVKAAPLLGTKWKDLGHDVLRYSTRALCGKKLRFSVMHGDFAPWNTRVRRGELLTFDWESSHWEGPTSWDMFHFLLLTEWTFKKKIGGAIAALETSEQASFMLYLLSSVCQFVDEGSDKAINFCRALLEKQLHISQHKLEELRPIRRVSQP